MLQPNTLLQGRYLIVDQIGRGGMGAVYKATDTRLRSTVALKQTLVAGDPARRAFEREAQLLAGLRHPALPRVSDHFMEGDGQFLVMEFIPGDDLAAMFAKRGGPFPTADVLRWADQLLDALDYLHSQQPPVIHRDIKPQNIKLTTRGEIILLDFGLAKGSAAQLSRVTSTGSIFGYTPHYAPLEQIQGAGTSARSDLYSLAATLHHLLTGNPPPDALTRAAAMINETADPLTSASAINPAVSPAIAAVLTSALSQKPSQRPASATAMRAALKAARHATSPLAVLDDSASAPTITTPIGDVPTGHMVIVAPTEAQAHASLAQSQSPAPAPLAIGTTQTPRPTTPLAQPAGGRVGKPWLWAAILVALALLIGGGFFLARDNGSTTASTNEPAGLALEPTSSPTTLPATNTPEPTIDILQAAAGTQTAMAVQQADMLATARMVLNATDFAATQTAIALTPTVTPPPTEAAPAPTEAVAATSAPQPASSPKPAPTARPTSASQPTAAAATSTPAPTATTAAASGSVISTGGGSMFRGTANLGKIAPEQGAGGSCIEGKISTADGGLFSSLGVQIDQRGNTRQVNTNIATGTYGACGLSAGEWGISIYAAGGVNIPGSEQAAHQVRVLLTGTPGEIFYVNFTALPGLVLPSPTPEPAKSPYDGIWRGTNSGTTTTGDYPPGRFEIEVRNGTVYRISVDGPSCPFETYPNGAKGSPINGNSFAVSGSVYNPATGENSSIQVNISGVFASESSASGNLSAQQNGAACANASWSARK